MIRQRISRARATPVASESPRGLAIAERSVLPGRLDVALWLLATLVALVVSLLHFDDFQVGAYQDDATYIILARSLIEGPGYGMINQPGSPGDAPFAFGYPLLLAPLVALFPDWYAPLRLTTLLTTLLNGALIFFGWSWLQPRLSHRWGTVVASLYLLSPLTTDHARMVMSEAIFTTIALLTLVVAERLSRGRSHPWLALALGVLITLASLTRIVGVLLIPAVGLWLLYRLRWRALRPLVLTGAATSLSLAILLAATPASPFDLIPDKYVTGDDAAPVRWLVALLPFEVALPPDPPPETVTPTATDTSPPAEVNTAAKLRDLAVFGLRQHVAKDLRAVVFPLGGGDRGAQVARQLGLPSLDQLLGYLVGALTLLGALLLMRRVPSLFLLFALVYSAAIFFWVWVGPRLLYPIQPQLHLMFIFGALAVVRWVVTRSVPGPERREWIVRRLAVVGMATLVLLFLYKSAILDGSIDHIGDLELRTGALGEIEPGAVVMSEAPAIDHLYSGQPTLYYPAGCPDAASLEQSLRAREVSYVIIAPAVLWLPEHRTSWSDQGECLDASLRRLERRGVVARHAENPDANVTIYRVLNP